MKKIVSGDTRLFKARLTSLANIFCQIIVILTGIVSIPMILNYVGKEDYSLWVILTTIMGFMAFSDLGLGIGLQDKLSKLLAISNQEACRKLFLTTITFVGMVLFLISILAGLYFYKNEVRDIYYSVLFVFMIGVFSGIISRVFNAFQEGYIVALIQLISRLVSFFLLFFCISYKLDFYILIFLVSGLSYFFTIFFGMLYLFLNKNYLFTCTSKDIDFSILIRLMNVGLLGFGASISIYFVNNTGPLIVSVNGNSDMVVFYSIVLKIITMPIMLLNFIYIPLWPAISEAYLRKDNEWLLNSIGKMKKILISSILFFPLFIALTYQYIVGFWIKGVFLSFNIGLFSLLIVFMILSFWNAYLTTILNGFSRYKSQATYCLLLAVVCFFVAYVFGKFMVNAFLPLGIIVFGYFLRCIFLQIEVQKTLEAIND